MLNVACFVQSCLTDADFVIFSNYCLIGTRLRNDGSWREFFIHTFAEIDFRHSVHRALAGYPSAILRSRHAGSYGR